MRVLNLHAIMCIVNVISIHARGRTCVSPCAAMFPERDRLGASLLSHLPLVPRAAAGVLASEKG